MNVALTPEMTRFVEEKVRTGIYRSPEEAVNALLSNVASSERLDSDEVDELRAELDLGIAEADRGDFTEFTAEHVIAEGRARRAERRKGA